MVPEDTSEEQRKAALAFVQAFVLEEHDLLELAFRYGVEFTFLDLNERDRTETKLQHGFLWLNAREQFIAVTGEDRIVKAILEALERALGQRPVRVAFDRTVVDANFDKRSIWSISNIDLRTGFHWRTSGQGLARDEETFKDVITRDDRMFRDRALYAEGNVRAFVNVLAGKLNVTVALPASALRAWAGPKLREIARSQRELQKNQPIRFYSQSEALQLTDVPKAARVPVRSLVPAVMECRGRGVQVVNLPTTAAALLRALPVGAARSKLKPDCAQCGAVTGSECEVCKETDFVEAGPAVVCARDASHRGVSCTLGHAILESALLDSITLEPLSPLWEWISDGLAELGEPAFDPTSETFDVRGSTFTFQHQKLEPGTYTALAVDIEASTPLRKNDPVAFDQLTSALLASVRKHGAAQGARSIRDGGDGAVLLFPRSGPAATAAALVRDEMASMDPNGKGLRFALATGPVSSAGRVDGLVFHRLARLEKSSLATRGSRIVVDQQTLSALAPAQREGANEGTEPLRDFAGERYYQLRN